MAGPKNPEQLRGALGAFRRRLQEAERPKDPVLDLQVDRGLDPSKAPVPVPPASPRFQAPMIPEEPDLPPVSSGAYKGVEDIANRVINTPTDRRSFLKGTGQAINALKFMNSPLARLVGKMVPEEAPVRMSQDEALATILRDMIKESGVFEKYRYDPEKLVVDDKGIVANESRWLGHNLGHELFKLRARAQYNEGSAADLAKRYKELTGEDIDRATLEDRVYHIMEDLGDQAQFHVNDIGDVYHTKGNNAVKRLNEDLDWKTQMDVLSFVKNNPDVDFETAYRALDPSWRQGGASNGTNYYHLSKKISENPVDDYDTRRFMINTGKGKIPNAPVDGPSYDFKLLDVEGLKTEVKNLELSRQLLDEFLPEVRTRFQKAWDRAHEEIAYEKAKRAEWEASRKK